MLETYSLRGKDRLLLIIAPVLVSLPAVLVDHQAGLREAVHAQSLREMIASGSWFIPTVGNRLWLESLPLTHWIAGLTASGFGVSNVLTAVRLAGMLPLVLATIWTASFAAKCSGRRSGILAGVILLTMFGVAANVWHGSNVIWLIAAGSGVMKLLADLEGRVQASFQRVIFVFVILGLATMIAGPIAALVTVLIPAAGHVLLRRDPSLKVNNPWIAGWLVTAVIAAVWPVAASTLAANSSAERFSTSPGLNISAYSPEQLWQLTQMSLPWLPLVILGQWSIRHDAFAGNYSRERLLACWSLSVPVAVLLLSPSRMNFALAAAGAWSVSAAIGVEWLAARVFKELPMLETRHNRAVMRKFLAGCAAVLTLSTVWSDAGPDSQQIDRHLLSEARAIAEQGQIVCVDMDLGDQAALVLLELDELARPLDRQSPPDSWENMVVISSESFQRRALKKGQAARLSDSHSDQALVRVRINSPIDSQGTQIAAEPGKILH